eukprot:TRINITY_DN3090_c0_g1_i2.p1 TRINITY_DN3090_c0_g1~~TRINITY_DN3090_c0_g1_i2.p1  ORF type:complete len:186 (+),score=25.90 TRINITY_DN3090_c0_g1_i2:1213-1770(+)
MISFVEREKAEKEECLAQCNELRKLLKAERENHADTRRRLKLAHESTTQLLSENKAMKEKIEELENQQSEMSEQRGYANKGSKAKLVPEFELDSKDSIDESKCLFKKRDTIGLNQPVSFLSKYIECTGRGQASEIQQLSACRQERANRGHTQRNNQRRGTFATERLCVQEILGLQRPSRKADPQH